MSRSRPAAVSVFLTVLVTSVLASAQQAPAFRRIQLHDQFWSEGASAADLNNDGAVDVIAGPWWWEGPAFTTRHEFYPAKTTFELELGPPFGDEAVMPRPCCRHTREPSSTARIA